MRPRQFPRWVLLGLVALTAGCAGTPAAATSSPRDSGPAAAARDTATPQAAVSASQHARPSATPVRTPEPIVGTEIGQRAPPFSLTTTEGARVSLDELRGRPVWINFWATTCPPCIFEMPLMEGMYLEHKASGLEIVGIAVGDTTSAAVAFGDALGITYPLAVDALGVDEALAVDYEVFVLPTHYFIDADGIVRGFIRGEAPPEVFDVNLARIVDPGD